MMSQWKPALVALSVVSGLTMVDSAEACMFGRRREVQTAAYYQAPCSSCAATPTVAVAAAPVVPVAPVVACAPQPVAVQETRMVQRCYLAPVTTMQTQTQYENVTTYRTEFYDEAVTTMQTSAYYDPCNCGYRAVSTPVTSTVRRSRVVPVTQTVARNYAVPVTTYEQRTYLEPVTETKLYYPATPTVAQYVAPVVAQYVAPTVAQYVAPVAAAPAVANYVAPAAANYLTPAPANVQQAPATAGGQPQFYQNPNGNDSSAEKGTWVIERMIQNGQVIEENKRYYNPGEAIPPARQPAAPESGGAAEPPPGDNGTALPWDANPARPSAISQAAATPTVRPVSLANPYYR